MTGLMLVVHANMSEYHLLRAGSSRRRFLETAMGKACRLTLAMRPDLSEDTDLTRYADFVVTELPAQGDTVRFAIQVWAK